ncbi:cytochrome c biogenesis protein CcsA [Vogesella fluminis]|uniref:cytochrome c biogenesis protein CcsA n=1 Tax=Vogesella fluminis TaxID=1069161 RepID=UPI00362A83ED
MFILPRAVPGSQTCHISMSGLLFILVTLLTFGYLGLALHYLGHWRGHALWPRQSGIEHSLLGTLLLLHAIVLVLPVLRSGTVSLGLGTALSLLSWMMLLIFWTGSYFSRMEGLQTFLVPVAFVTVLLAEILPLPRNTYAVDDIAFLLHMVVSLLAYSLFAIGALIAILMLMQERALHERKPGRLSGKLPPAGDGKPDVPDAGYRFSAADRQPGQWCTLLRRGIWQTGRV